MPLVPHRDHQRERLEPECTSCGHIHPSRPVRLTNPCKFSTIHTGEDNETFSGENMKKEVVKSPQGYYASEMQPLTPSNISPLFQLADSPSIMGGLSLTVTNQVFPSDHVRSQACTDLDAHQPK